MSYLYQKCKKFGGHCLRFRDFEKLSHIIEHGLQGSVFINLKSTAVESYKIKADVSSVRFSPE